MDEIKLDNPIDRMVLHTALDNYAKAFNEHLKTSKDEGFIADDAIYYAIKHLKALLNEEG